jgi:glyoxylate reductase
MTQRPQRPLASPPRVIVTRHLMPEVEARMRELFDVVLNEGDVPLSRDALAAAMQDCDVLVPTVTDRIDGRLMARAGQQLRLIAQFGVGVNNIDVQACISRGITVTNTPGVLTEDTADMTMALILAVSRRLVEGEGLARSGEWQGWAPTSMRSIHFSSRCALSRVGNNLFSQN